ncbi:hypothetical protein V6N13_135135 [Hibiscus sabdariffa]|uniref:Uncharacterized protein n=1 Tax=Hibiscus sabdariffa TaxID=183260 RepID=A0ABR2R5X1_9ROSI
MAPQISEGSANSPRVLGDDFVSLTGVINGRPPDPVTLVPVPSKLERVAQPLSEEDQQVVKRSRGEGDAVMDVNEGGSIGLNQDTVLGDGVTPVVFAKGSVNENDGAGQTQPSFRDMVMGRRGENSAASIILELDVEMDVEDVLILNTEASARGKGESSEKYGPWMLVSGRKARRESRGLTVESNGISSSRQGVRQQGKFDILASLEAGIDGDVERIGSRELGTVGSDEDTRNLVIGVDSLVTDAAMDQVAGKERIILQDSDSVGEKSHAHELASVGGSDVVSPDMVVPVRVSLDPKAHVAVQVVESGMKMDVMNVPSRRATTSVSVASVKNNARLQLGEWIGELEHELDDSGKEKSVTVLTGDSSQRKPGANVQWRTNTVFSSKQNQ